MVSIVLNIAAEGTEKSSDRDFNRYIQNSLSSVINNEVAVCVDIVLNEKIINLEVSKGYLKERNILIIHLELCLKNQELIADG